MQLLKNYMHTFSHTSLRFESLFVCQMTVSTPGGDNDEGAGGVTEAGGHALNELKSALELFQPHLCVLVLRHPAVNYASLHSKVGRLDHALPRRTPLGA